MGVFVVVFLLFAVVVVYSSPWCSLVLACFFQHLAYWYMSEWYISVTSKRKNGIPCNLLPWDCKQKPLRRWKPLIVKEGKLSTQGCHFQACCQTPGVWLVFTSPLSVKLSTYILQLLYLLKIKGDSGWPQANTSLLKHQLYRTIDHDTIWSLPFSYTPAMKSQLSHCFRAARQPSL